MTYFKRRIRERCFAMISLLATIFSVICLLTLLIHILLDGIPFLRWSFLTSFASRFPESAGIKAALVGSFYLLIITIIIAVPLGVASALFLEEYAGKSKFITILKINILNLAGMPSVVYGLLGVAIFSNFFGLEDSLLAGGLTLSLLVLPIIIISSQEAIRAVPDSVKQAAYAMGARKWQVIFGQILPGATPSIMTGVILSISRAIGETAPLLIIGALSSAFFLPNRLLDSFIALPIQIFNWASRPQSKFHELAAAGIVVLLVFLFIFNFIAIYIRQKFQKYKMK